jgi:hypothetical protein
VSILKSTDLFTWQWKMMLWSVNYILTKRIILYWKTSPCKTELANRLKNRIMILFRLNFNLNGVLFYLVNKLMKAVGIQRHSKEWDASARTCAVKKTGVTIGGRQTDKAWGSRLGKGAYLGA